MIRNREGSKISALELNKIVVIVFTIMEDMLLIFIFGKKKTKNIFKRIEKINKKMINSRFSILFSNACLKKLTSSQNVRYKCNTNILYISIIQRYHTFCWWYEYIKHRLYIDSLWSLLFYKVLMLLNSKINVKLD